MVMTKSHDSMVTAMTERTTESEQKVNLPHDGMIGEYRDAYTSNGGDSGYYPGGIYQYTKVVFVPNDWQDKHVFLMLEGIQGLATITINGIYVQHAYNPYTDTQLLLDDYFTYDANNHIEIMVNNAMEQNSRWYTGSGIYRDVSLWLSEKTYIPLDGLRVKTLDCSTQLATLAFDVNIINDCSKRQLQLEYVMYNDKNENVLSRSVSIIMTQRSREKIHQKVYIQQPHLWNDENPYLYCLKVRLLDDKGKIIDEVTSKVGIRKVQIDPYNGLQVNGEPVKLKGTCLHHDNGILGAVCLPDAERRKLTQLKDAGFNSIRSAHNPMATTTLQLCDELGFYVIDELTDIWNETKNVNDYANYFDLFWKKDIEKMVAKDFNHPSVIMYSNGNEIREVGNAFGARLNRQIVHLFHANDPTRYVTSGINGIVAAKETFYELIQELMSDETVRQKPVEEESEDLNAINGMQAVLVGELADAIASHKKMSEIIDPFVDGLDIAGYNYLTGRHELEKERDRIVLGMETFPADIFNLWQIVMRNPHVIGDFTWTGYDYLGEAGVGVYYYDGKRENFKPAYPDRAAYIGDIDLIGHRRPISYYREIIYGQRGAPYIAVQRLNKEGTPLRTPWMWGDVISSWTWTGCEGKLATIEVYSPAEEVELFLNGQSLGKQPCGLSQKYITQYFVPYEAGTLEVVNYDNGQALESYSLETAAAVSQLLVTVDKTQLQANGQDLAYILIQLADEQGHISTLQEAAVTVTVEGVTQLVALGNANPSSEGNYFDQTCATYDGQALAILRAGTQEGSTIVKIEAEGLDTQQVQIHTITNEEHRYEQRQ